jgi:DNA-binding transcriptional MerR regulator
MKSSAVVTMLNMPESTLRKYARDYSEYLSPAGTGGAGRHRDYTDHDIRVLKLVRDMKLQNVSNDDIDVTLGSLQAGGWDRLPALDESAKSIIPAPGALIAANADRGAMQREIDLLREMLDEAKADRDELMRRLHRAETLLELYQTGQLKPKE